MILYIGHFFSEEIVCQRGIPFRNSAGSKRIFQIANAIYENNKEVEIISPGISLWSKPRSKFSCTSLIEKNENLNTYYAKTARVPFLNIIISTLSILKRISFHSKNSNLTTVIIYNFSPEFLVIALFVKTFTKAKFVNNVEDISIPKLADWKTGTESRAFQQIIFFFCMKLIARMADGFIVPTKRFSRFLPVRQKKIIVVTGCSNVNQVDTFGCTYPLKVLFSGKLLLDQGIDLLLNTLEELESNVSEKLIVSICGEGPQKSWIQKNLAKRELSFIKFYGFLSDSEYVKLLANSDICLVLQNPEGRYKNLITPSKFFDYYSKGKYIITSNVGDYDNLPEGSLSIMDSYTSDNLHSLIKYCVFNLEKIVTGRKTAYNFAMENFQYKKVGLNIITSLKI